VKPKSADDYVGRPNVVFNSSARHLNETGKRMS